MTPRPNRIEQAEIERRAAFSRRRFLRGLGACVAVPSLASLRLPRALAAPAPLADGALATTATGAPLRTAFLYFPNGAIPKSWWPKDDGPDFELSRTLEPLASSREFIQVLGGLNHRSAEAGPDGAGDHARGGGTFLTGVRLKKSASDIRAGVSIDQVFARAIGHLTRFPSLELACEPARKNGACDSGYSCAYQYNLSWSTPTTPMTPESNPRLVFERLFGAGASGERRLNLQRRRAEQRSVLDFVLEDAQALQRELDSADRGKLDQYLTGVRELEQRIEKVERFGDAQDPGIETPVGVPTDYEEYIQLMFDMMILAFQTDSTRVATFLLAHDGSNRSFDHIGISEGHHDLSHHQNRADWIQKVADIDLWYVRQLAKFLDRMRATTDSDGSPLLRNAMIVYGSGNADGNRHTHSNLPLILAGGGGGTFTPGRYVKHRSKPLTNLFLSMADRLGVADLPRFGDSTERLGDL
jgi:hypothetical protein